MSNKTFGKCETCVYFGTAAIASMKWNGYGDCNRYPQTVNKQGSDWCGEHKAKEQPKQPKKK